MAETIDFVDHRGRLLFPIKGDFQVVDSTVSINKKYVFRGIHFNNFEKLITCIHGEIIDIVVDPQTLSCKYYHLFPGMQVRVPPGYGHGFLCLVDDSILLYHLAGDFSIDKTKFMHYSNINLDLRRYGVTPQDLVMSESDSRKDI